MFKNRKSVFALMPITFFTVCLGLSSCAVTSKTADVDIEYVSRNSFVMAKPLAVDVKIENRKITGRATVRNSEYQQNRNLAITEAKKLAVIDAVKKGDADVLIQPLFETESDAATTTATVTGFAARYNNFRPITASDTTAFFLRSKMGSTTLVSTYAAPAEASASTQKRKKSGGKSLLTLVAVVGGVLLLGSVLSGGQ